MFPAHKHDNVYTPQALPFLRDPRDHSRHERRAIAAAAAKETILPVRAYTLKGGHRIRDRGLGSATYRVKKIVKLHNQGEIILHVQDVSTRRVETRRVGRTDLVLKVSA